MEDLRNRLILFLKFASIHDDRYPNIPHGKVVDAYLESINPPAESRAVGTLEDKREATDIVPGNCMFDDCTCEGDKCEQFGPFE